MNTQSVSESISAIAADPSPAAIATLLSIAAVVARMERALDEHVANAMFDWRMVETVREKRRGRFAKAEAEQC